MAIQKPELHPLANQGPWGHWQANLEKPQNSPVDPEVAPRPPDPHDPGMEARLAKLESVVGTLATKSDVEGVRTDLHKMDASIVRWMLATVVGLFLGFAGLFFTMQNSVNGGLERAAKAQASASQQEKQAQPPAPSVQPIVIQLPSTVSFPITGASPPDNQGQPQSKK